MTGLYGTPLLPPGDWFLATESTLRYTLCIHHYIGCSWQIVMYKYHNIIGKLHCNTCFKYCIGCNWYYITYAYCYMISKCHYTMCFNHFTWCNWYYCVFYAILLYANIIAFCHFLVSLCVSHVVRLCHHYVLVKHCYVLSCHDHVLVRPCYVQEVMESVCNPLFKKDISKSRTQNCSTFNESNQPWFSENCKQKREVFFRNLDVYRFNKDDNECRVNMVKARSDYKKELRKSRLEYRQVQTQQLEMHRYDNAKSYWKLLKKSCSSNSVKTLSFQSFADYFKAINNPDSIYFQQMMTFHILINVI